MDWTYPLWKAFKTALYVGAGVTVQAVTDALAGPGFSQALADVVTQLPLVGPALAPVVVPAAIGALVAALHNVIKHIPTE